MDVQNEINELRRKLIAQLSAEREKAPERRTLRIPAPPVNVPAISDPARIYQVRTAEQLTPELAELKPDYIYFPAMELAENFDPLRPFIDNGARPVAVMPRVITDDQSRERAQRALNEFLRPEFLNRIDEIVYFNHLTEENFRAIAALMLDEVRAAMAERGMTLHWTPAVIDYLVRKGYSETYGARNLRRTIQRDVEDAIASAIVARRKAAGDIGIDAQDDHITVTINDREVNA